MAYMAEYSGYSSDGSYIQLYVRNAIIVSRRFPGRKGTMGYPFEAEVDALWIGKDLTFLQKVSVATEFLRGKGLQKIREWDPDK